MFKLLKPKLRKWFSQLKQKSYLNVSDRFTEQSGMVGLLGTLGLLTAIVVVFIIWMICVDIEEAAIASGEIVTQTPVQSVQHLEGGIVKAIKIKNGKLVEKDQTLIELDETAFMAELEEMQMREISLLFDAERLRAYSHAQELSLREILQRAIAKLSPKARRNIQSMIDDEQILLRIQQASKSDQKAILESQISQNLEELNQLNGQKEIISKQIDLLKEERTMYTNLQKKAYFSKRDFLKIRKEINQAYGELNHLLSDIKKSEQKLNQTRRRLSELVSNLSKHAASELGKVTSELLEVQRKIENLQDKVSRTRLTAVTRGTVQGMEIIVGSVIGPGQILMKVIPHDSALIAKVRINPKDRGHINVGDPVNLKVSTYDFPRYGAVPGKLKSISASTFKDENSVDPYYVGTITLDKQYVGHNPKEYPLLPGMIVQADIVTGHRTLFAYLLKPIHSTLMQSFHER